MRTSYVLIAVLAAVGTLTISSAFAALPPACVGCEEDARQSAQTARMQEVPVTVWTDKTTYDHKSSIKIEGAVANIRAGDTPVTLTVISPTLNIVTIDQLPVDSNGRFSTTLSTQGNLWKYDGTYTIRVQYGNQGVSNKALVELTGGAGSTFVTPTPTVKCQPNQLSVDGRHCVPYNLSTGTVTSTTTNTKDNSIVVSISSTKPGTLSINPSNDILRGVFMVLVDGEESNDVTFDGNKVTVEFPAGTEKIEFIGTFVIPEFGAIAALILAVAIISIIVVSAKTRLSITPKF
ncbi:MAG TPA: PEFG-CTERM sorting domain-containing protein [Nitrosopumilaceae archaeon]|nr:PEFG-CTERM sorting domain-containing protein [Nitrosopumilaceae archaeon]